jgi:hypothetical protein
MDNAVPSPIAITPPHHDRRLTITHIFPAYFVCYFVILIHHRTLRSRAGASRHVGLVSSWFCPRYTTAVHFHLYALSDRGRQRTDRRAAEARGAESVARGLNAL